jgi:hypothetical protein
MIVIFEDVCKRTATCSTNEWVRVVKEWVVLLGCTVGVEVYLKQTSLVIQVTPIEKTLEDGNEYIRIELV